MRHGNVAMIRRTTLVLLTLCALVTATLWYYCWPPDYLHGYGFNWHGHGVDLPWGIRCSVPTSYLHGPVEGNDAGFTMWYRDGSSSWCRGRLVRIGYQIECTVPLRKQRALRSIVERRAVILAYCWPLPDSSSVPGRSWGFGRMQLLRGPAPHVAGPKPPPDIPPGVGFPDPTVEWGCIAVRAPLWLLFAVSLCYPILAFVRGPVRRWRRRRRGLCVKCGYNLTGNVSGVCPECGTALAPTVRPGGAAAS
jgi:hypothetical protein